MTCTKLYFIGRTLKHYIDQIEDDIKSIFDIWYYLALRHLTRALGPAAPDCGLRTVAVNGDMENRMRIRYQQINSINAALKCFMRGVCLLVSLRVALHLCSTFVPTLQ
jgi:hypothetical protein